LSATWPVATLALGRILFGAVMTISCLRFLVLGWVEDQYVTPKVHFPYYGFEWVQPLGEFGMYAVFIVMTGAALGILLGYQYRITSLTFALLFTYVELIDKTYYLNHYYFVSIAAFLFTLLPANVGWSIDALRRPSIRRDHVPRWTVDALKLQLALVYIHAGLAKISSEWLIDAMPLRIWLPAHDDLPLLGPFLTISWMPWVFSWAGMLFDCTIPFFLLSRRTRLVAWLAVLGFHVVTGMMFQIGVFPLVMIAMTLIFFSPEAHLRWLRRTTEHIPSNILREKSPGEFTSRQTVSGKTLPEKSPGEVTSPQTVSGITLPENSPGEVTSPQIVSGKILPENSPGEFVSPSYLVPAVLAIHFFLQLLIPWRFLLYPGNRLWTEQGYRFGWRVMLIEKAGTATFYVRDGKDGREGVVYNSDFLNAHQEKQMSMQPDMIVQFAGILRDHYRRQGMHDPHVRAEVWVTLNGAPSKLLVDPQRNLAAESDGLHHFDWILHHD